MHILLIHQYFLEDDEGGGSRWNELSRIFIENGHSVTVLAGTVHYMRQVTARKRRLFETLSNRDGAKVIRCFTSGNYHKGFLGRLLGYFSFTFSAVLAGIFLARDDYDVVVATSPPLTAGISGWIISRWRSTPLLLELRDLWPESAIDAGVLHNKTLIRSAYWLERFLYRKSSLINVLTPAFREVLIKKKNISTAKIIQISNAADFGLAEKTMANADLQELRRNLNLPGSAFVIIYVGAHGVANHLTQILEAAELLKHTQAFFLLIGDGAERAELFRKAFEKQLQNVRFLDPVSKNEIFNYILASDAGTSVLKKADVFKTVYSNKTFDYFSCKKPVLMAIDGISRELVEASGGGMFVEPENPVDFAHKVEIYLSDKGLVKRQGENGYLYAKQHFDREVLALRYLRYLEEMIGTEK